MRATSGESRGEKRPKRVASREELERRRMMRKQMKSVLQERHKRNLSAAKLREVDK